MSNTFHNRPSAERLWKKIENLPTENKLVALDHLLHVAEEADAFVRALSGVSLDKCSLGDQRILRDRLQELMRALRPKQFRYDAPPNKKWRR